MGSWLICFPDHSALITVCSSNIYYAVLPSNINPATRSSKVLRSSSATMPDQSERAIFFTQY